MSIVPMLVATSVQRSRRSRESTEPSPSVRTMVAARRHTEENDAATIRCVLRGTIGTIVFAAIVLVGVSRVFPIG